MPEIRAAAHRLAVHLSPVAAVARESAGEQP
jgi:hypothetical protein